jgi:CheY-like chemotaxis protein
MLEPSEVLKGKVLIVDDQLPSLRLLERLLVEAGYTSVTATTNAHEVCALHRQNRYDLILLDLVMPGLNGFQVLECLKEVEPHGYLSVLVMTAYAGHRQRALKAGAKDFINKPFNVVEVQTRVYNLLELRLAYLRNEKTRGTRDGVRKRTLLYVEDNGANLKLIEKLIARRPNMRLLSAQDGSLGVALAQASRPEVILMDITLPGISGVDALKLLREDPATAHIPVVALSARARPRDIANGLKAGFFRYLTKPLRVDEFMATLDLALALAEASPDSGRTEVKGAFA